MIKHPGLTTKSSYWVAKPSNHPHMPIWSMRLYPPTKTWPITALYCIFSRSVVSQHPLIQRPLGIERRIAESMPVKGGTKERHFLPSQVDGGLYTIGTRRISCDPPAPHMHNPRHMARGYRSGTNGDNEQMIVDSKLPLCYEKG